MISDATLAAILPEGEALAEPPPREVEAIGDDPLRLTLAQWCAAIRSEIARIVVERGASPSSDGAAAIWAAVLRHALLGVGIVDVERAGPFPSSEGVAVGVAIYAPLGSLPHDPGEPPMLWLSLSSGTWVPVLHYASDFRRHAHPSGGRAAAVVTDDRVDFLLTARHVVGSSPTGARVVLDCPGGLGTCRGTVRMKGHHYLDVALIEPQSACCLGTAGAVATLAPAVKGGNVVHHFGSTSGPVLASVLQGVGPAGAFVNAVAPLTFLTDGAGSRGDSGSAVTLNLPNGKGSALAGSYSGVVDIRMPSGAIRRRGFAHDADEAMQLFQTRLKWGIT